MFDWQKFWNDYPKRSTSGDYLGQVGKTVGGQPISLQQIETIITSVSSELDLQRDDRLLDLCCGNGLLTRILGRGCSSVVGVDFSVPLIETAKAENCEDNVTYHRADVRTVGSLADHFPERFTKVLCYEALAFLTREDLDDLLGQLEEITVDRPTLLLGSVLDRQRRWNFFDTLRRKLFYVIQIVILRREVGIGRWWTIDEVGAIAERHGLQAQPISQDPSLHTAHYRFDILLVPK